MDFNHKRYMKERSLRLLRSKHFNNLKKEHKQFIDSLTDEQFLEYMREGSYEKD
jgi:hypothetical protein